MNIRTDKTALFPERRVLHERRSRRLIPSLFSRVKRRSSSGRRRTDTSGYVDRYDLRTWAMALSVLILSCLDAVLTFLQMAAGRVHEVNPLMDYLIHVRGPFAFFGIKAGITAFALAVIILHKEWKIGRIASRVCLWSYILLSLYHLYLVYSWKLQDAS